MKLKHISFITGILLLIGILRLPYSYYEFLRIFVSISAVYFAYKFNESKQQGWLIIFGMIALLFNPIAPVYLSKETWILIDIVAGGIFLGVGMKLDSKTLQRK